MSETESLLRELVEAERARANAAERMLEEARLTIAAMRADQDLLRSRRKRDAARKNKKEEIATISTEIPRKRRGKSKESPPPQVSPDSPHTPHITPSYPPTPVPTGGITGVIQAGGGFNTLTDQPAVPEPQDSVGVGVPSDWVAQLAQDWEEIVGGVPNYGTIGKAAKGAVHKFGIDRARVAWKRLLADKKARQYRLLKFSEDFGDYEPQLWGVGGDFTPEQLRELGIRIQ